MRIPSNKLKAVIKFAKSELMLLYEENEIQSFFYLLCEHYLKMDRTSIILNPEYALSESELLKFNFAIKDLKKEKPIQYILGKTDFCGFSFQVNEHTLIPRPETEELVHWIYDEQKTEKSLQILDIGTGSGCIAISLAKLLPNANISAIDISSEALKIAKANNIQLDASVSFELMDILNPSRNLKSKFDLIVSNPPYVLESEKELMKTNVLDNEPAQALFVRDNDSLLFYRRILDFAQDNLLPKGKIYFEINEKKAKETVVLLEEYNYSNIEVRKDIFERQRMIRAIKN